MTVDSAVTLSAAITSAPSLSQSTQCYRPRPSSTPSMIPAIMVVGAAAGVNPARYVLPVTSPRRAASCCRSTACRSSPTAWATTGCSTCCPARLVISAVWVVLMTALLIVVGPLVGLP